MARAANFRDVHWRDRQSVPIFVGVETIEHKTQAVFDRYLHRGARGPEGSHRPYGHAQSGDTRTASLDGRSASSENS